MKKHIIVGMTGASGMPYAFCLLEECLKQGHDVHLIVTDAAWRVMKEEHQIIPTKRERYFSERYAHLPGTIIYHPIKDIGATIASGSYIVDAMVIIPCSMGTLAKVAHGLSSNLLERAADVMIKERRPLIMVPRETPLSTIHLENMLSLSRLGVTMVPAMPGFYHQPKEIEDQVRFIAGKVLDLLGIDHNLYQRWKGGN